MRPAGGLARGCGGARSRRADVSPIYVPLHYATAQTKYPVLTGLTKQRSTPPSPGAATGYTGSSHADGA